MVASGERLAVTKRSLRFYNMSELIFNTYLNEPFDTQAISLMKINHNSTGGGGSGTGGAGIVGVGSPEGVVTATPGTSYFDTSTNSYWYKRTGSGNTGWFEIVA